VTADTFPKHEPLKLGSKLSIWPPVVLAPMAGVTNYPYRKICNRYGAGLCVSEMVSSRGILEGHRGTWRLVQFGKDESPRSIQIFGCDPNAMGEAARQLVGELGVDHIDINFGCPVRKLVNKGMGAAVPADENNCRDVVRAVVQAADPVPVTIKVRLGLDDERFTFRDAGKIALDEGCQWIAVHGRTAKQMYSGKARWEHIAELNAELDLPVLGNGDIFEAEDGLRRMQEAGVPGIVIGRGCLGNPWLFRDLLAVFEGKPVPPRPPVEEIVAVVREHFQLLLTHFEESARAAILRMRKFGAWYATGFHGATEFRRRFSYVESGTELEEILEDWLAHEREHDSRPGRASSSAESCQEPVKSRRHPPD
jgi:nifR3 family TIM-barrel protein